MKKLEISVKKYKDISVGLSSGTSGHRGMFITTPEEQGTWAGTILAKMLPKMISSDIK